MNTETASSVCGPDPAAIFGAALSLWKSCHECVAKDPRLNLSESYNGVDEFMRQVMGVATMFESWCCDHVDFKEFSDVWPYFLQDKFGDACVEAMSPTALGEFDEIDCLRLAMRLRLPVRVAGSLAVPVNLTAANPNAASLFRHLQIRSVRRHHEDNDIWQYTVDDEPDDADFGDVFFGLYGLDAAGFAEHIADRDSYSDALTLSAKLAPGISFPESPTLVDSLLNA
jgi:hypothetical protein